jgi:hypothetical protein
MSNVITLFDCDRKDCAVTPPVEIGIHGLQSLLESWSSINSSIEQLQHYLDHLRPVLDALPDSPEKSNVSLSMMGAETQIRDSLSRSISAGAAIARVLRDSG